MVSKKTLQAYEFESMEAYFQYIIESKINGQHGQVDSLISAMSKEQKKHCLIWIDEQVFTEDINYCKNILIAKM